MFNLFGWLIKLFILFDICLFSLYLTYCYFVCKVNFVFRVSDEKGISRIIYGK